MSQKNTEPVGYKEAGVDKKEGYKAVQLMKRVSEATRGPQVLGGIGAFGSLYELKGWRQPVLVAGTDGVGTKLRLALDSDCLEVIGRDCYAMVANDIACHGARPLFFLDYLACGSLDAVAASRIVGGMAEACREDGCALVGGETAEMPGYYAPGDYEVAGFAVGAVEKDALIDGREVKEGDAVIGIASNGVHSNGFSLIRAVFHDPAPFMDELLKPTRLYGPGVRMLMDSGIPLGGLAHITGGGLPENLPRGWADPDLEAHLDSQTWEEPPIFGRIRETGVKENEMRGTFNLGIGFALIVHPCHVAEVLELLKGFGEEAWCIGSLRRGTGGICFD